MRILISRTDHIGDVVLTLPVAFFLKKAYPEAEILFLGSAYVAPVVKQHPAVDQFKSVESLLQLPRREGIALMKSWQCDVILHVMPNKTLAQYAKKAKVPVRIGTSKRYYHWWTCNRLVKLSRAKSTLHEAQLNLQLLKALDLPTHYTWSDLIKGVALQKPRVSKKIKQLVSQCGFCVVLHPGSQGNTKEWPVDYFVLLARALVKQNVTVLITGTVKEKTRFQTALLDKLPEAIDLMGKLTLNELMQLLTQVAGIVVGGTGPLHMAGALGVRCLGLFPAERSTSTQRWGPIGKKAQALSALPEQIDNPDQMYSVTVPDVEAVVLQWRDDSK